MADSLSENTDAVRLTAAAVAAAGGLGVGVGGGGGVGGRLLSSSCTRVNCT